MKYRHLILKLDPNKIYTPATIAAFAEQMGLIDLENRQKGKLERQRIRIALGRFSNNHSFPDEGDGMVTLKGQAPTPGWYGRRWQAALKP